jgi:hypothetical protein
MVGGVCFDCFHNMDDKQLTHLITKAYIDTWKNIPTEKKPNPKVEFFESTRPDVLKEQLEEFLSTVDRIISINYTVFEWRYHVMVVYT